jgi:hypothetical protein
MGHQAAMKDLRKQLRNVVQEILPEVLNAELVTSSHKAVTLKMEARLDAISKYITGQMETIDQRSRDVQDFIIRASAPQPQAPAPAEVVPPVSGQ